MIDLTEFIQTVELNRQATQMIVDCRPLHAEMAVCMRRIIAIMKNGQFRSRKEELHDLRDRMFACRIQIEAAQIRSKRLHQKAAEQRASLMRN